MNTSLRQWGRGWGERVQASQLNRFRHGSLLHVKRTPVALYAMGFLSFFLFGLVQAGYGPSYPLFGREYGQSATAVGAIASLHFAATAVGILALGLMLRRLSLRNSLMFAFLILLLGLLGVALSPAWGLVLASAALGGLGYGVLSAGFNLAFAELGPGPSNLVNGMFGVGSVVSPTVIALMARPNHAPPFLLMAALAAVLAVSVRLLWPKPLAGTGPEATPAPVPLVSRRTVGLFGLCFFLYVGIEAGFGNWATTYLSRLGAAEPAVLTSGYWLALTAGRFASAALGSRLPPRTTITFATCGAMLGSALMLLGGLRLAPAGLMLAGFCIAPIFSAQLAWFTRTQRPNLAPYMLMMGGLGGALLPALTGWALPWLGPASVPLSPLLISALLLALVWRLDRLLTLGAAQSAGGWKLPNRAADR